MNTPYNGAKIYGPYLRKDGRKHIIAVFNDGTRKTTSYPKYLVELNIGRYLLDNETVDHVDRDYTNDSITNLVIREKVQHSTLDAKRLCKVEVPCQVCNTVFTLEGKKLHRAYSNKRRGMAGPYCSRSCAGKASRDKSMINVLPEKEYFYLEK